MGESRQILANRFLRLWANGGKELGELKSRETGDLYTHMYIVPTLPVILRILQREPPVLQVLEHLFGVIPQRNRLEFLYTSSSV